mgnify:CR=1 FL=1
MPCTFYILSIAHHNICWHKGNGKYVLCHSQNNKQRALPPVPIQQVGQLDEPETDTTSNQNQIENIIEPDVELNRRITPEIRPEDFPPGVAYLPDGDDDDFDEEDFNSKSNNKIDFASTIKTVKNVRNM